MNSEVVDILFSFTDFEKFKNLMIYYQSKGLKK